MTAITNWSDQHRGLGYACSEMGEVMSVNMADGTVSSVKAIDSKTVVMAASTSLATAVTHVIAVHPQVGKLQTKG
jgi:hypothetical protein